jgi:sorbitol-specific phosphotransferase system component IIBC
VSDMGRRGKREEIRENRKASEKRKVKLKRKAKKAKSENEKKAKKEKSKRRKRKASEEREKKESEKKAERKWERGVGKIIYLLYDLRDGSRDTRPRANLVSVKLLHVWTLYVH